MSPAKADPLVSGNVYNQVFGGSTCSSNSSSASGLSLHCSDSSLPLGFATLTATTGAGSGSVTALANSVEGPYSPLTYESVGFTLSVTGTYELTGGAGSGFADLSADEFLHGAGGGGSFSECQVTLDGQTQSCATSGDLAFYVPYNTPLVLDFEANYSGAAEYSNGLNSGVTYDFSSLTDVSPVPEPASLALVGLGLIPVVSWGARRMKSRQC